MSPAWLDQWLKEDATVLRRAKSDVEKKGGGGGASKDELLAYLNDRTDGPFTVLEIDAYYVLVRGTKAPTITVHQGTPSLA